jgi:hypothetical protein
MGGDSKSASGAQDLINMLNAKTAMDLGLNMGMSGKNNTAQK